MDVHLVPAAPPGTKCTPTLKKYVRINVCTLRFELVICGLAHGLLYYPTHTTHMCVHKRHYSFKVTGTDYLVPDYNHLLPDHNTTRY